MNLSGNTSGFSEDEACDPPSFDTLFRKSYAGLVFFSFKIISDRQEAEDIVQDAFIQYWNRKSEITGDLAGIKRFLYTTVRNSSLNLLKRQKVASKFQSQLPSDPADDKSIESEMIYTEVISEIHNALQSLPDKCKRISEMSYLEGKKNHEIAEELGISVNTVKTQKQRALLLLKQKLGVEILGLCLPIFMK